MRYRLFGPTCTKTSEVGFGGWAIGGGSKGLSYGPTDDNEAIEALASSYDMGCNFYDTADVYGGGHSEKLIGKALKERRPGVLIATKGGLDLSTDPPEARFTGEYLAKAAEESLKRLDTDWIDLYQLHSLPPEPDEAYQALDELKASGKIRWAGVSVQTPEEALAAIASGKFEAIQVRFNLVDQRMLKEVFPAAKRAQIGLIVREPLANGLLTGKYESDHRFPEGDVRSTIPDDVKRKCLEIAERTQPILNESTITLAQLAIKYALAFDVVSTVVAGIKDEAQLEDNMEAGIGDPITEEEFAQLTTALETVNP